jgi:hypothetical protein
VSKPSGFGSEDMKAAAADPMVQRALELFDGSMVHVERTK